jgi:hypothetical protein
MDWCTLHSDPLLPGYVLLIASSMRAVDLFDSGLSLDAPQVITPQARPGAGMRLGLMNAVLETLDRIATDGATGYVEMESLVREIGKTVEAVSAKEVIFVCRFLDAERECLYVDPRDGREKGTRSRTRLVHYDNRRERVKLSDAGRFFLRMGNVSRNWLYEDKHAAKIVQAIRLGEFADVEQFTLDHIRALRELAVTINSQIEAPSLDAAASYIERRVAIDSMMQEAAKNILLAKGELLAPSTQDQLDRFNRERGDAEITLARLRWLLDGAHRAMESASRTWAKFLTCVQDGGRKQLGIVNFEEIADQLLSGKTPEIHVKAAVAGVLGWTHSPTMMSVAEVMAVLPPPESRETETPLVFANDDLAVPTGLQTWIERNYDALREALLRGPQLLSSFIDGGALGAPPLESIDEVSAVFGTFVVPNPLGENEAVEVVADTCFINGVATGFNWATNDLVLSLRERIEDLHDSE